MNNQLEIWIISSKIALNPRKYTTCQLIIMNLICCMNMSQFWIRIWLISVNLPTLASIPPWFSLDFKANSSSCSLYKMTVTVICSVISRWILCHLLQRQIAVTAYFTRKQLLLFVFVMQVTRICCHLSPTHLSLTWSHPQSSQPPSPLTSPSRQIGGQFMEISRIDIK